MPPFDSLFKDVIRLWKVP